MDNMDNKSDLDVLFQRFFEKHPFRDVGQIYQLLPKIDYEVKVKHDQSVVLAFKLKTPRDEMHPSKHQKLYSSMMSKLRFYENLLEGYGFHVSVLLTGNWLASIPDMKICFREKSHRVKEVFSKSFSLTANESLIAHLKRISI